MIISKSPYLWLGVSLTCCALALGFIPQMFPDSALTADKNVTANSEAVTEVVAEAVSEEYQAAYVENTSPMKREVYKIVDQMPIFAGKTCGDIMKYKKRKVCADKAMLGYIYSNIRYPKKAKDKGVQGMAVVGFVVEAHGAISTIRVVRDPGTGLGKAALKVVKRMKDEGIRFEPGLRKGKPVAVEFMLPVKFELKD